MTCRLREIGDGVDGVGARGVEPRGGHQQGQRQDQETVAQRKIDQPLDHRGSSVFLDLGTLGGAGPLDRLAGRELRLRIDQEAGRGHHPLPLREPGDDLDQVPRAGPETHLPAHEAAGGLPGRRRPAAFRCRSPRCAEWRARGRDRPAARRWRTSPASAGRWGWAARCAPPPCGSPDRGLGSMKRTRPWKSRPGKAEKRATASCPILRPSSSCSWTLAESQRFERSASRKRSCPSVTYCPWTTFFSSTVPLDGRAHHQVDLRPSGAGEAIDLAGVEPPEGEPLARGRGQRDGGLACTRRLRLCAPAPGSRSPGRNPSPRRPGPGYRWSRSARPGGPRRR